MGPTQSRTQDASLGLAVPKFTSIAGRRLLDPSVTRCTCCDSFFIPLIRKKHYCRRCAQIICEGCSVMRHYKQRDGGWLFRICRKCNSKQSILDMLQPNEKPWRLIMEYAGDLSQHRILQTCRRTQLSYHLPYRWGLWEELFTDQTFLAKGANGAVFRTTLRPGIAREFDTPAARGPVAVKVIQKNSIFSLRKWSHIQRELDTLKQCRNPHVIELIGVFQSPDAVYIILEFAQGGDLFDWLVARRKPKEAEVRAIAVQLIGTVFMMHDRFGCVHRDIKPENILLKNRCRTNEEPHLKFADFGFARRYPIKRPTGGAGGDATTSALLAAVGNSGASASLIGGVKINASKQGSSLGGGAGLGGGGDSFDVNNLLLNATPCGTLGFAPPEVIQAYNARKADPTQNEAAPATPIDTMKKMDIFALGVTLSILLTGQEPFPVHSSKAHMQAVQSGVNMNTRPWQYVSQQARNLIRKMLAPKVQDRPHALECLRSDWFEGTGASDFLHRATEAEIEEDVRTFQKSVRSLKNRPEMIYAQNKDGQPGVVSKAAAVVEEESHILEDAGITEEEGKQNVVAQTPMSASSMKSIGSPGNNNNNATASAASGGGTTAFGGMNNNSAATAASAGSGNYDMASSYGSAASGGVGAGEQGQYSYQMGNTDVISVPVGTPTTRIRMQASSPPVTPGGGIVRSGMSTSNSNPGTERKVVFSQPGMPPLAPSSSSSSSSSSAVKSQRPTSSSQQQQQQHNDGEEENLTQLQ